MYWYLLCQQLDWSELTYEHSRRKVPLANRLVFCLSPCLLVKTSQPQSLRFFGQKILHSTHELSKIQDPWLSQGMYFGMVSSLRRMSTVASPPNSWQWQFGGDTILRRSINVPSLATVPGRRLTSQVMFSIWKPTTLTKINQVPHRFLSCQTAFWRGGWANVSWSQLGLCLMIDCEGKGGLVEITLVVTRYEPNNGSPLSQPCWIVQLQFQLEQSFLPRASRNTI